jgi:predicted translin family RNA/ssDNA-binding protein
MYTTINNLMDSIVADLQGINASRYQHNVSGGMQEYMEAVLFQQYLETQCLLPYNDAANKLPSGLYLTYEDYLLGIFDMTGELMRFAITYMATNGKLPGADDANTSILADMQDLRSQLEAIDTSGSRSLKDFDSKMRVTRQSVEKVENGVYSMLVRGKERPKGWKPDTDLAGPEIETY